MTDFKSLTELFSKISLSDLGKHYSNLTELYTKPIKSWKKIISYRNESYTFFLLFVLYYSAIIFFLVSNNKYVIPITILELVITLIPFSFLYLPFIFFRKKWNKKIQSNRLFRLLFIIKVQFGIILIGCLLLSKWTETEGIYIFIENFIWLILLVFISALPFLLKLKLYQKIIWTFTNYVFSLIFFLLIGIVFYFVPDFELITEKTTLKTPNYEHLMFQFDYEYSDFRLDTKYFIALMEEVENKAYLRNTQFATTPLTIELMKLDSANLSGAIRYKDSLAKLPNTKLEFDMSNYQQVKIGTEYLDSIRLDFNKSFFGDKKLTDSLSKHAKFKSNKKFYELISLQLSHYDSIYTADQMVKELFKTKPELVLNSDKNVIVGLFKFEDDVLIQRKNKIEKLREKLSSREEYSSFLQSIYVFPIEFIMEKLE